MKIEWRNKEVLKELKEPITDHVKKVGFKVENKTKELLSTEYTFQGKHLPAPKGKPPSLDTGRLRASISTNWTDSRLGNGVVGPEAKRRDGIKRPSTPFTVAVGTNVEYGCIYGRAYIRTKRNPSLYIGNLRIGDEVLTQDGNYHPVEFVHRYSCLKKPDLTEITVEWRKDANHTLILTQDHKIAIYNKGLIKWKEAGKINIGEEVFIPKKKAIEGKQENKWQKVKCSYCEEEFEIRKSKLEWALKENHKVYCCKECGIKGRTIWHIGQKMSRETKEKISNLAKERFRLHPEKHLNSILSQKGYQTKIEKEVEAFIKASGYRYETQFKVGKFFVDFALIDKKVFVEADGGYWHLNQQKDIERDKAILSLYPDWQIIHLHFADKRSPHLIENPLPAVKYRVCNSSIKSIVNEQVFKAVKVLSRKNWTYSNKGFVGGNKPMFLYDIGVKDIHSFVANGLLVANSSLEMGHGCYPHPYLRPAFESVKASEGLK